MDALNLKYWHSDVWYIKPLKNSRFFTLYRLEKQYWPLSLAKRGETYIKILRSVRRIDERSEKIKINRLC